MQSFQSGTRTDQAQGFLRGAQGHLRGGTGVPKGAQGYLKGAQRHLKGAQGYLRGLQRHLTMHGLPRGCTRVPQQLRYALRVKAKVRDAQKA